MDKLVTEATIPARQQNDYERICNLLLKRMEDADFSGWDPFDALNSRLFHATPIAKSPLARLAFTQLFKRSPVNLRQLARMKPSVNPVTIALASEIYRRDGNTQKAHIMMKRLLALSVQNVDRGYCGWGYPFPWQSKAFYVTRNEPNTIATAYAVRELSNWPSHENADVGAAVVSAARMMAGQFVRKAQAGGLYIAYVQGSDAMVHNASLWGAYILAQGWRVSGEEQFLQLASEALAYSAKAQRSDGSWAYGEAGHHQFTDGFHTGYVLEALHRIGQACPALAVPGIIERGLAYYFAHLFEDDGTAKYYNDKRYPIDGNCAAQLVITLDTLGRTDKLCERVMDRIIEQLWLPPRNYFAYQRNARRIITIEYTRWTQIWLALALKIVAHR